jgi:hypothetical protein
MISGYAAGVLAAVLARLFPRRGRHHHGPDDTVILPKVPEWDGGPDQSDEKTRLNLDRVRPYVDRRDPPDMMP